MTFVLAFSGSRGDVQPAVALGVALAGAGHAVRLAVPPNLVEFGRGAGLETHPFGADTGALLGSELVRRQLKSANPRTRLRAIAELTLRDGRRTQRELAEIAAGADVLIGGSAGQERVLNVATALDIPYLPVHYCPLRRNGVVSLLPADGLPPAVHRIGWTALEQLLWLGIRGGSRAARAGRPRGGPDRRGPGDPGLRSAALPRPRRGVGSGPAAHRLPRPRARDPRARRPGHR